MPGPRPASPVACFATGRADLGVGGFREDRGIATGRGWEVTQGSLDICGARRRSRSPATSATSATKARRGEIYATTWGENLPQARRLARRVSVSQRSDFSKFVMKEGHVRGRADRVPPSRCGLSRTSIRVNTVTGLHICISKW